MIVSMLATAHRHAGGAATSTLLVLAVSWLVVSVLLHRSLRGRRTTRHDRRPTARVGTHLLPNRAKQPPSTDRTTTPEAPSDER